MREAVAAAAGGWGLGGSYGDCEARWGGMRDGHR